MSSLVHFSTNEPIDVKKAIELLGGQPSVFYNMLGKLETMSLMP
jgi:hypothetical protein